MWQSALKRLQTSSNATKRTVIAAVGGTLALLAVTTLIVYRTSIAPYRAGATADTDGGFTSSVRRLRDSLEKQWGDAKETVRDIWRQSVGTNSAAREPTPGAPETP